MGEASANEKKTPTPPPGRIAVVSCIHGNMGALGLKARPERPAVVPGSRERERERALYSYTMDTCARLVPSRASTRCAPGTGFQPATG
jgi:hypothetical protein